MNKPTITGPWHPLLRRIHDHDHLARRLTGVAADMWADHSDHGLSDQTVYRLTVTDGWVTWSRVGPVEDHGDLLHQGGYIAVRAAEYPDALAARIAQATAEYPLPGSQGRATALRDAAGTATPTVAALLAVTWAAGCLDWDTGESLHGAARRLCLDAGWRLLRQPNPVLPAPGHIWDDVLGSLGVEPHPVADYARAYLDQRAGLDARLAEAGIRWGAPLLDARQAAGRSAVGWSTWRSYVIRQEVPAPDEETPARWHDVTVDAWRHTRPRKPFPGW